MVKILQDTYTTFKSIFIGMSITFKHLFVKSVTVQYPRQRDVLPERIRMKLNVNIDDCIGCRLCEKACPVECIEIETIKSTAEDDLGETSSGHKKRLWLSRFDIDLAKCCYCELCVHPCPTGCISMISDYEYSVLDRKGLYYRFAAMSPVEIEEATLKLEKEEEEKKRKKEEARRAKSEKSEKNKETEKPKADSSAKASESNSKEETASSTSKILNKEKEEGRPNSAPSKGQS